MNGFRCDICGRFVRAGAPGTSWSQSWSYDMTGFPELHDIRWRCSPCTDKEGVRPSNCRPDTAYRGRVPKLEIHQ